VFLDICVVNFVEEPERSFFTKKNICYNMDSINVAIRIRPLNAKEASLGQMWTYDESSITQVNPSTGRPIPSASYTFGMLHLLHHLY
jgi:hypothetical protein